MHVENQGTRRVKLEIEGNVNFKIKSQFMHELREDTFSGNKDEDAHDHIDWFLNIVGLFNIPGVSKDAVMLRVFPFTLTGSAKRWCPTHDINSHQKVNICYKGLSTMNHQLLDSQGPILGMRPAEALTAIQTMADHSQKWHDGTTSRNIGSKESARRSTEMEVLIKKLQENAEINTRNQSASLKNLETQIEQLTKEIYSDKTLDSSSEQIKIITAGQETSGLNKLHGVSFISDPESDATEVLQH
ncbi:hypothetical protein Tco_0471036 [Tanacetum coccineum]